METSNDPRPPIPHPVYGALGARRDDELARLGIRRDDIPWRGPVLRVDPDDARACFGEAPKLA